MASPLRQAVLQPNGAAAVNPSNPAPRRVTEATRIPMSVPTLRLQVPDIPGWHLHWMLDRNVSRALKAGYVFVSDGEVDVNNLNIADDPSTSGSTDLGSRISVAAAREPDDLTKQTQRLYLMKLPQEWWDQDQAKRDEVNEGIARTMRAGMAGAEGDPEKAMRYLKEGQDMFVPRRARR